MKNGTTHKCGSGKKRFRDHKEATRALHRSQLRQQWSSIEDQFTRRRETRAYECYTCNGWHLTSQNKRVLPGETRVLHLVTERFENSFQVGV